MTTLADIADQLKEARRQAGLTQQQLADRAGLNRLTVGRMENLTHGDMSVAALVRLLEGAGFDLKVVKTGHLRTLEDILREQVLLALPMQKVCEESCKGICPFCGQNRNQKECHCHAETSDDRWAALKSLKS